MSALDAEGNESVRSPLLGLSTLGQISRAQPCEPAGALEHRRRSRAGTPAARAKLVAIEQGGRVSWTLAGELATHEALAGDDPDPRAAGWSGRCRPPCGAGHGGAHPGIGVSAPGCEAAGRGRRGDDRERERRLSGAARARGRAQRGSRGGPPAAPLRHRRHGSLGPGARLQREGRRLRAARPVGRRERGDRCAAGRPRGRGALRRRDAGLRVSARRARPGSGWRWSPGGLDRGPQPGPRHGRARGRGPSPGASRGTRRSDRRGCSRRCWSPRPSC